MIFGEDFNTLHSHSVNKGNLSVCANKALSSPNKQVYKNKTAAHANFILDY